MKKKKLIWIRNENGKLATLKIDQIFYRILIFSFFSLFVFLIILWGINTDFFLDYNIQIRLALLGALMGVAFSFSLYTILDSKNPPRKQLIQSLRLLFYFAWLFLIFNGIAYLGSFFLS